ncbi:flagellin [Hathewaya limosa]|uniref:Flagellin n=1 Tax=Hathewaya limosa TaxID=1536 RepID=A0ABU0JQ76_HATLI|nr:flagellin [Hathewaya limosa]MDQ0479251.1 flagellin [Hathewaya limosa]
MRISHNLASLNIYRNMEITEAKQSKCMTRINTGSKLNRACDDPTKIGEKELMTMSIRTMQSSSRNVQDTMSMLQTADGGLQEINDNLIRLKELMVQAGDGSLSDKDKDVLQNEINQVTADIDYLAKGTNFNKVSLLDGSFTKKKSLIDKHEEVVIPDIKATVHDLGLNADVNDVSRSLDSIDKAIKSICETRGRIGGLGSRLEDTYNNIQESYSAVERSLSLISDADVGEEAVELAKNNILMEAGNAIMVQTNKLPMDVLSILGNMK